MVAGEDGVARVLHQGFIQLAAKVVMGAVDGLTAHIVERGVLGSAEVGHVPPPDLQQVVSHLIKGVLIVHPDAVQLQPGAIALGQDHRDGVILLFELGEGGEKRLRLRGFGAVGGDVHDAVHPLLLQLLDEPALLDGVAAGFEDHRRHLPLVAEVTEALDDIGIENLP